MWDNTLMVFASDNGGDDQANNYMYYSSCLFVCLERTLALVPSLLNSKLFFFSFFFFQRGRATHYIIFVCRLTLHWLAKILVNLSMFQRLELSQ